MLLNFTFEVFTSLYIWGRSLLTLSSGVHSESASPAARALAETPLKRPIYTENTEALKKGRVNRELTHTASLLRTRCTGTNSAVTLRMVSRCFKPKRSSEIERLAEDLRTWRIASDWDDGFHTVTIWILASSQGLRIPRVDELLIWHA